MGNNYVVNDLCKKVIEMGFMINEPILFILHFLFVSCIVWTMMLMITMMTMM